MTAPITLAPITLALQGDGRLIRDLRAHGAPIGAIQIVEQDAAAILIDLPPAERPQAVAAALRRGQTVLCPPPVARTEAELAQIAAAIQTGGGRLLPAGEIAHSEPGRRGLAAIAAPEFGQLRSLYLAIRQPKAPGDVLEDLLPEALDTILTAIPGPFPTIRLNAAPLFGPTTDTAIILLRAATGPIVTIELSRCLPPTIPAPALGEIELDAVGTHQSIRILPNAAAVRLFGNDTTSALPWLNAPVLAMLQSLAETTAEDGYARAERALKLTQQLKTL